MRHSSIFEEAGGAPDSSVSLADPVTQWLKATWPHQMAGLASRDERKVLADWDSPPAPTTTTTTMTTPGRLHSADAAAPDSGAFYFGLTPKEGLQIQSQL